jgi:hypothetical protein
MKTDQYNKGRRDALREVQTHVYRRAKEVKDPKAQSIWNSVGFEIGTVFLRGLKCSAESDVLTPGECPECGQGFELVRPGKSQPTCDCQDKCEICGTLRRHFAVGEISRNMGGFMCPVCDAYKSKERNRHAG